MHNNATGEATKKRLVLLTDHKFEDGIYVTTRDTILNTRFVGASWRYI